MNVKIVSACEFANIGDRLSAKLLKGYVDTFLNCNSELVNYENAHFSSREDVEKFCCDTDLIIVGNGGILQNVNMFPVFNGLLYNYFSCPIIMMTTGFNFDFYDTVNAHRHNEISELFRHCSLIGLRTSYDCVEAVNKYGVNKSDISICPDVLSFVGYEHGNSKVFNLVGVSLYEPDWYDAIKSIYNGYIDKELLFINHESSDFKLSDYSMVDYIITNRFHGIVLAFAYNKPCFIIQSNIKHVFGMKYYYGEMYDHYIKINDDFCKFLHKISVFNEVYNEINNDIEYRKQLIKTHFVNFLHKLEEYKR